MYQGDFFMFKLINVGESENVIALRSENPYFLIYIKHISKYIEETICALKYTRTEKST